MSKAAPPFADPRRYTTGSDRYIHFSEDFIGLQMARTQKRIHRAVAENQRVLIVSGNGVGKSFGVAALILAFLYTNPDSTVMGTSGTYSQFLDTMWRPMKTMLRHLQEAHDLPGRRLDGSPEVRVDDDWFAKVVSHRDPGNLEGRHAENIMVVIEEADKKAIEQEHFDSAGSSITDPTDRMVAIANPPTDETDVVYQKMQSDRWEVIQFSSFESHNVLVDAGVIDGEWIPGLVDLPTLADDWEAWNEEPWPGAPEQWDGEYPGAAELAAMVDAGELDREDVLDVFRPGFETVRYIHEEREDLDERWYRRRAGVIPPDTASVQRPWSVTDVEDASASISTAQLGTVQALAYDVARMGGDWNVIAGYDGGAVKVLARWKGVDHNENFERARSLKAAHRGADLVVDAQGEGSGVADRLVKQFPGTVRFHAGSEAVESAKYYDKWTEGLYHFGQFLSSDDGTVIPGEKIEEELSAAARTVTFEERFYASRNGEVLKATPKAEVEERLDRSPDVLDAAYMAVWAVEAGGKQQFTW